MPICYAIGELHIFQINYLWRMDPQILLDLCQCHFQGRTTALVVLLLQLLDGAVKFQKWIWPGCQGNNSAIEACCELPAQIFQEAEGLSNREAAVAHGHVGYTLWRDEEYVEILALNGPPVREAGQGLADGPELLLPLLELSVVFKVCRGWQGESIPDPNHEGKQDQRHDSLGPWRTHCLIIMGFMLHLVLSYSVLADYSITSQKHNTSRQPAPPSSAPYESSIRRFISTD